MLSVYFHAVLWGSCLFPLPTPRSKCLQVGATILKSVLRTACASPGTRGPPPPRSPPTGGPGPPRHRPHPRGTGSASGSTRCSPSPVLYRPDTETRPGRTEAPAGVQGSSPAAERKRAMCGERHARRDPPAPATGRLRSRSGVAAAGAAERQRPLPPAPSHAGIRGLRRQRDTGEPPLPRSAPLRSAPLRAQRQGPADEAPTAALPTPGRRIGPELLRREPERARGGASSPRGGVSAPGRGGVAAGGAERRHWPAAAVMSPI